MAANRGQRFDDRQFGCIKMFIMEMMNFVKIEINLFQVKRSPSLRSEQSSLSESRTVRFNQDVSIKRIPKKVTKTKSLPVEADDEFVGKCEEFVNIPPPSDQQEIADEAESILRQLDDISCSVSPTANRWVAG